MRNYYDDLEVSQNASKEIIGKVYKILAKKYHPDTTTLDKQVAEEKFKIISEAYEVLSDDVKRNKYDLELKQNNPNISYEDYMNVIKQRDSLNNALNNLKNKIDQSQRSNSQFYANTSNKTNFSSNTYKETPQKRAKKTYYYTDTGKIASSFDVFKYKIKNFVNNFFIVALILLIILSILNNYTSFNLLGFLQSVFGIHL